MSARPDITGQLDAGETLIWQGHPAPGRRLSLKTKFVAAIYFALTILLALLAWYFEIFWGYVLIWHLAVYVVIGLAALFTFLGLRVSLLDQRRARARDRQTAYAITDRRALVMAGPYRTELPLTANVAVAQLGDNLTVSNETDSLRFERLDDAAAARDILLSQIEGGS